MSTDPPCCRLSTVGRRTGRAHTIEIWFARCGRSLYLLAGGRERADWVRNLMATPTVAVQLADGEHRGTARVVAGGSEEDADARRLMLARYQASSSDDLEAWGRHALVVAVDLDADR